MGKTIDVFKGAGWHKYTIDEFKEEFNFSSEIDYENIFEVVVHRDWLKIAYRMNGDDTPCNIKVRIYDKVFGTYVLSNT